MPQLPPEYAFSAGLVCPRVPPTLRGSKTTDGARVSPESRASGTPHSTSRHTCLVPTTAVRGEDAAVSSLQCLGGKSVSQRMKACPGAMRKRGTEEAASPLLHPLRGPAADYRLRASRAGTVPGAQQQPRKPLSREPTPS